MSLAKRSQASSDKRERLGMSRRFSESRDMAELRGARVSVLSSLSPARRLSPRKRISQSSGRAAPAMPGNGFIRCCVTGHLEARGRLHPAPVMSQTGSDFPPKD
ncbi:unnamed protein product [Rangifer tarandus platyrhynchus]|uniref:Uncharacterized protein n=1 Tax=Rangifer tarandus platyrhynchus TaxID=3082113 RepID=A0ABN8YEV3_RANTA|nr:unnamed protein product [Rangifer tarandus platyrhynchus]